MYPVENLCGENMWNMMPHCDWRKVSHSSCICLISSNCIVQIFISSQSKSICLSNAPGKHSSMVDVNWLICTAWYEEVTTYYSSTSKEGCCTSWISLFWRSYISSTCCRYSYARTGSPSSFQSEIDDCFLWSLEMLSRVFTYDAHLSSCGLKFLCSVYVVVTGYLVEL